MNFNIELAKYFENMKRYLKNQPLVLNGGGGGFQGQLPQSRVTFDVDEFEDNTIPASGVSLVTNLNRIRYRVSQLETGTGVDVEENGTPISNDVTILNFAGDVNVTETTSNEVLIQVTSSGTGVTDHGGLTGLFPDDDHPQYLNTDRGDARYYTQDSIDAGILNTLYMPITDINNLFAGVIDETIFSGKGDLIVGSGVNGFGMLSVGNDDEVLVADSTQTLGVKWAAVSRVEYEQIVFTVSGQNLSATGVRDTRIYSYLPVEGGIIREVYCYISASPTTQALRINVKKNGSDFITGGYVQIPVGGNSVSGTSFTNNVISNNDYFQFEIVQGDPSAANLTIHLRYTIGD